MGVAEVFALAASAVAVLGFLITLYKLSDERKTRQEEAKAKEISDAVKTAETARKQDQMEKDITHAYTKIVALESTSQNTALSIARIEVEMRTMRESTQHMEAMLDGHLRESRDGRDGRDGRS
jgi:DNA-binding protein